jgi:hypothetical protein
LPEGANTLKRAKCHGRIISYDIAH